MINWVIPVDMYRKDIVLVFGKEEESIKFFQDKFKIETEFLEKYINDSANGCTICSDGGIVLCWVRGEAKKHNVELLHELDHAANFILRSVGIEHTVETEECYTYLKTNLHELVFKQIDLHSKNNTKEVKKKKK